MVTKPTGDPRGRRRLPLREDPERYWIARYVAECFLSPGLSARGIAVMMTAVRFGERCHVWEPCHVWDAAKLGDPNGYLGFRYVSPDVRGREGGASENRRNSSAFHARADDLARKARRLLSNDYRTADDRRWFLAMTEAWMASLAGKSFRAAWLLASSRCLVAGETAFFRKVMELINEYRFQVGPEPRFSAPDFIPHPSA